MILSLISMAGSDARQMFYELLDAEIRRQTEKGRLLEDADRVRAHPLRDPHGRHPVGIFRRRHSQHNDAQLNDAQHNDIKPNVKLVFIQ